MSYQRNSYKKLRKIIRNNGESAENLTDAQKKRVILWALTVPEGRKK